MKINIIKISWLVLFFFSLIGIIYEAFGYPLLVDNREFFTLIFWSTILYYLFFDKIEVTLKNPFSRILEYRENKILLEGKKNDLIKKINLQLFELKNDEIDKINALNKQIEILNNENNK